MKFSPTDILGNSCRRLDSSRTPYRLPVYQLLSVIFGIISWLFLPATVFVVIFCMIEMGKPDFESQIYNMKREFVTISDYNTMDIWDFNEKYGFLWDFTVKKDDIKKENHS
ncbi:hypothetical protein HHK36_020551 [Tetracentron sinense]|uniref:Uncharacterized protein n=1 Tax=Tetracentron sinense TaxID=13715 RepID=A0A834YXY1_TETSI|nr:hypothetical protein HHK36_020551 [Tetracentron sinense]